MATQAYPNPQQQQQPHSPRESMSLKNSPVPAIPTHEFLRHSGSPEISKRSSVERANMGHEMVTPPPQLTNVGSKGSGIGFGFGFGSLGLGKDRDNNNTDSNSSGSSQTGHNGASGNNNNNSTNNNNNAPSSVEGSGANSTTSSGRFGLSAALEGMGIARSRTSKGGAGFVGSRDRVVSGAEKSRGREKEKEKARDRDGGSRGREKEKEKEKEKDRDGGRGVSARISGGTGNGIDSMVVFDESHHDKHCHHHHPASGGASFDIFASDPDFLHPLGGNQHGSGKIHASSADPVVMGGDGDARGSLNSQSPDLELDAGADSDPQVGLP